MHFVEGGDEIESLDADGDPTYIYCMKFCPKTSSINTLALGSEDGVISILDISKHSAVKTEFTAHENAIFDIAWMPGTEEKVRMKLGSYFRNLILGIKRGE